MNDLTCNSICRLFCCPPVPSKIAAKLAFMPPPASYEFLTSIENGENKMSFTYASFLKENFMNFVPDNIEVTTASTRRGNKIAILYMQNNPSTKLTFLLSHGNAVDLGLMVNFMYELGTKLDVNMMCYDYSGYGVSSGRPLEKNLYADAECALDVLRTKFEVPLDKIVLYGQSIGTVPTVHLATLHRVAAVVLHSPLMSGLRVAFPRIKRNYCCDVFSNLARAPRILSPTLVIHGTSDEVVHVNHGYRICSAVADHLLLDPLFIDGAGHNDCETFPQYLLRLITLTNVEIPLLTQKSKTPNPDSNSATAGLLSSQTAASTDSETTNVSPSNSLPLTHLFHNGSLEQVYPSVWSETQTISKKIPPMLAEQLRSLLSNRFCLRKSSQRTACSTPITKHSSLKSRINASCSAPNELSGVHEAPVDQLLHTTVSDQMNTGPDMVFSSHEPTAHGDCESTELARPRFSQCSSSSSSRNSSSAMLTNFILPPPPPPPPNVTESLIAHDALWSMHNVKNRKTCTLPRGLIAPENSQIQTNGVYHKHKGCTLPRSFLSADVHPSLSDIPTHSTSTSNNSIPELLVSYAVNGHTESIHMALSSHSVS
ncbi:Alpha/beta hydrolase domain-containing protein 17C [Paragonimus westermani]|uniref:Alpha/beta hydrolase domain-containing protein 17C n=1 Tax=Paragonimus westermani TaxID=34504 RepID=A0A8T0DII3_9TREM|nr:Alpha/beta hydrolase domain-containing protein 17C [Paragonimus westermani]